MINFTDFLLQRSLLQHDINLTKCFLSQRISISRFFFFFRIHKVRWPGTLPLANQVIGNASDEDDITAMLNLFCANLAEKSAAGVFVMTLSDLDIADSCSRLMEAIQLLSQTIKQLETFQLQKQTNKLVKSSPINPGPPPPSTQQLQTEDTG